MILMSMETENRLVINTFSKLRSLTDNTFSSQPRYDHFDTSPLRLGYYTNKPSKNQGFSEAPGCFFASSRTYFNLSQMSS